MIKEGNRRSQVVVFFFLTICAGDILMEEFENKNHLPDKAKTVFVFDQRMQQFYFFYYFMF